MNADISVCIATYKRLDRLDALLGDLLAQHCLPREIVVVDNDAQGSARAVLARHQSAQSACPLIYDIQPEKNISLTRNRTVALASGTWLAFIDDDERAPPDWLASLLASAQAHHADGVLGPVLPVLPDDAPAWIRRGSFYDWARMHTGTPVPANQLRFGNLMLKADLLGRIDPVFDPRLGLTGGEDGDLLMRLVKDGARMVWNDEATVTEPVEASRLQLRWILRRALRGGQDFARHFLAGRLQPPSLRNRAVFFARALLQLLAAGLLSLLTLPAGRHHSAYWLGRACANFGKLSVLWGWHYTEYA
ncbi:glycosyltransferase family 2 protein [Pigmentiphaga aceris]|uniref:Glycosyltransferase family 2 protein n=1 Tax=Pigmentiphaga aceris TaxID=1940612 RepID=A0A5C0B4Z5_9BURK|nr:glycosyltransferase [Pigmentiphaga aceris]QEI07921.1 glycosyltransferase family 2 protein [Pigmentiphaga aceris]